jgi:hypothetical protein
VSTNLIGSDTTDRETIKHSVRCKQVLLPQTEEQENTLLDANKFSSTNLIGSDTTDRGTRKHSVRCKQVQFHKLDRFCYHRQRNKKTLC